MASRRLFSSCRRQAQNSLPAAYYRGGTSRAIMFRREVLPAQKAEWDSIFLGCLGSPDPNGRQLDGMGGGISSLSKVCVVGRSTDEDADVDYTFAAVGIRDGAVDYSSNCGNMSAAVGPFAVDAGLVVPPTADGPAVVRIRNTNTGKLIHARFDMVDGEAAAAGDYAMDGVAGTAAQVRLDFVAPGGSRTGRLLPTGQRVDEVEGVRATLIDAGNPCCFVTAEALGVSGTLTPQQMEDDGRLMATLDRIRRSAGVAMGLAATPEAVPGSVPKIAIVSRPGDAGTSGVVARALSVGQPHKAIPVTVALALAAAAQLPGTTVAESVREGNSTEALTIYHASGQLEVDARYRGEELASATVFRTARRLMEGRVFWK